MATLNIKLDDELKAAFADKCRREGRTVSVVLREFMKTYTGKSNSEDYSPEFYAKIDEALKQKPIYLTKQEREMLYEL